MTAKVALCQSSIDALVTGIVEGITPLLLADCECVECPTITSEATTVGESPLGPAGTAIVWPHVAPNGTPIDFTIAGKVDCSEESNPCLAAMDPETIVYLRYNALGHDLTDPNGTTGYNLVMFDAQGNPLGTVVELSPTNTGVQNGAPNTALIGTAQGQLDLADRWVTYAVPLGKLCEGFALTSSAFGSVNQETETQANYSLEFVSFNGSNPIADACDC